MFSLGSSIDTLQLPPLRSLSLVEAKIDYRCHGITKTVLGSLLKLILYMMFHNYRLNIVRISDCTPTIRIIARLHVMKGITQLLNTATVAVYRKQFSVSVVAGIIFYMKC